MPRLLLINPNMSSSVTTQLAAVARRHAPPGGVVTAVTARFGPAYISSEAGAAIAAHAALDAWAADAVAHPTDPPSAVLIGCFGDPGLLALREVAACPVLSLAQASMAAAADIGPYSIVTGGAAWGPMLKRLAHALALDHSLRQVVTVTATGAQLAGDPVGARALLTQACRSASDPSAQAPVASIVLGGAALTGLAAEIQPDVPVPLIDSVECGVVAAWQACLPSTEQLRAPSAAVPVAWSGLSPELLTALDEARAG